MPRDPNRSTTLHAFACVVYCVPYKKKAEKENVNSKNAFKLSTCRATYTLRSHCGLYVGKSLPNGRQTMFKKRMDNKFPRCLKQNKRTQETKAAGEKNVGESFIYCRELIFEQTSAEVAVAAVLPTAQVTQFQWWRHALYARNIRSIYYERFSISWFRAGNEDKRLSKILKNFWWPSRSGSWSGPAVLHTRMQCAQHQHWYRYSQHRQSK